MIAETKPCPVCGAPFGRTKGLSYTKWDKQWGIHQASAERYRQGLPLLPTREDEEAVIARFVAERGVTLVEVVETGVLLRSEAQPQPMAGGGEGEACGHGGICLGRYSGFRGIGVEPMILDFDYVNYNGESSHRRVRFQAVRFGSSPWHQEPQWLMAAYDFDKREDREFALKDMTGVREEDDAV